MRRSRLPSLAAWAILVLLTSALPASAVTTPKQQFGFDIGQDYCLANYKQLSAYWKKLDAESDRLRLFDMGRTAEGRTMLLAVVTSPGNQARLEDYKTISRRLALADGLEDAPAKRLSSRGKAVVWIDGGLHATEVLGSQQLIELVFRMVSGQDPETRRILDDVILLACCPNPDGLDLVADWYMRDKDPKKRSLSGLPRLYQKYIGHDNNRDFYMVTQPETEAVSRVLYREWFPQVVYNHHQTGPAGTVLFAPPFRNPFNYYFDPLVPVGIDLVSAAMHNRFIAEGKPGATMRSGARYSTWWSGGLRSTSYFHNVIGILTETIGSPTPMDIPFLPQKLLASTDLPFPVAPRTWHFKESVEYMMTANLAILDLASRHREEFLYRRYLMGRNSIERGRRDHWTVHPRDIAGVENALARDKIAPGGATRFRGFPLKYYEPLRDPARRDPRGYIIPSDQPDFATALKFANTLIKNGVAVLRATRPFEAAGKTYPAGSLAVKCDQAFRPHILSQFEPQDHPHDFEYPGGPPVPPYDNAGWTLAFQMGVEFDRVLEGFEGPFQAVDGLLSPTPAPLPAEGRVAGYLLSHRVNDAAIVVNRLLAAEKAVYWLGKPFDSRGRSWEAGTIYIPEAAGLREILADAARELGLNFTGVETPPRGPATRLGRVRVGLWDSYGGSMPSGWVRWLLEQYEFPHRLVFAQELDAGELRKTYDVLIFVGGSIPRQRRSGEEEPEGSFREMTELKPEDVPEEFRARLGQITTDKTVPQLLKFVEEGGTILAIGSSTSLAAQAGLPLASALMDRAPDGSEKPLAAEKFYIPGSILKASVDPAIPLAYGLPASVDIFFNNSPVFRVLPKAAATGIRPVAWFEGREPLRSGWAWGQGYLEGAAAIVEAPYGRGRMLLFGPEITFRAQPHGTFKFLFNGIHLGGAAVEDLEP